MHLRLKMIYSRRSRIAITFLIASLSSVTCSKTPKSPAGTSTECHLDSVIYKDIDSTSYRYSISYSGNNITRMASSFNNAVFSYDARGNLASKEIYFPSAPEYHVKSDFITNTSGQITEQKKYGFINGDVAYMGRFTYEYAGTKLAKTNIFGAIGENNGWREYTWTNDDPTIYSIYLANGTLMRRYVITYNLAVENDFNKTYPQFVYLDLLDQINSYHLACSDFFFLGKHLIKSVSDPGLPNPYPVQYYLNGQNLPNTISIDGYRGTQQYQFVYSCN